MNSSVGRRFNELEVGMVRLNENGTKDVGTELVEAVDDGEGLKLDGAVLGLCRGEFPRHEKKGDFIMFRFVVVGR